MAASESTAAAFPGAQTGGQPYDLAYVTGHHGSSDPNAALSNEELLQLEPRMWLYLLENTQPYGGR